jgi:CheY-like chemotaxis protein
MFTQLQVWQAIDALSHLKGWSLSRLAVRAGLDPTALNRSKRSGPDGKPRWPSSETISKLLAATGSSLAAFCDLMQLDCHPESAENSARIVLVDDDWAFCDASASILRDAGYAVHVARGHCDALDLVACGQQLDLLCTDIVIPDGLGGPALARCARLRQPHLKVLYITGYDIASVEPDRKTSILRKPVGGNALLDEVARLLGSERDSTEQPEAAEPMP